MGLSSFKVFVLGSEIHMFCVHSGFKIIIHMVTMHDMGNCNMAKSAVKCQGNVSEFHSTGESSFLALFVLSS